MAIIFSDCVVQNRKTWISLDNITGFILNKQDCIECICCSGCQYNYICNIDGKRISEIQDFEANTPLELFMKIRLHGNLILEVDDI